MSDITYCTAELDNGTKCIHRNRCIRHLRLLEFPKDKRVALWFLDANECVNAEIPYKDMWCDKPNTTTSKTNPMGLKDNR